MPPESLIHNIYSVQTDAFSIGILLFELLTGATPWESRTEKDLIKKMTTVPFKISEKHLISTPIKKLLKHLCEINSK